MVPPNICLQQAYILSAYMMHDKSYKLPTIFFVEMVLSMEWIKVAQNSTETNKKTKYLTLFCFVCYCLSNKFLQYFHLHMDFGMF